MAPTRLLFVCTGNISLSPFAEYRARAMWSDRNVVTSSAGEWVIIDSGATKPMTEVAAGRGLDLTSHRARSLTSVDPPDLILCMEQHHVEAATAAFPDLPDGAVRLLVATGIGDPYGRPMDAYQRCADIITRGIDAVELPADG